MNVQPLVNQPTLFITRLILLTDGTVMTGQTPASGGPETYHRLTPDAFGNYVQGTWSLMASPQDPEDPQGYALGESAKAAVMADGRVLFIGPDVSTTEGALIAAVYDPSMDSWSTPIATDSMAAGEVLTCELADGTILCNVVHPAYQWVTGLFDLRAPSKTGPHIPPWHETPDVPAVHSATCLVLLPDGSALSMGDTGSGTTLLSRYIPHKPLLTLPTPQGMTIGAPLAAVLLPGDAGAPKVLCVGSDNETALYYPYGSGLWEPGPLSPSVSHDVELGTSRPACLEPSGRVLVLMPTLTNSGAPWELLECDGGTTSSVTYPAVPSPVPFPQLDQDTQMLTLPSALPGGEVLLTGPAPGSSASAVYVFEPDGSPDSAWAPQNLVLPPVIPPGSDYTLEGTQLNGLSQVVYGQNSSPTNYPLVRIRNLKTGHVFYCRTSNHKIVATGAPSMGVATDTELVSTDVSVPANVEHGVSELCVIANGIATCTQVQVGPKSMMLELKRAIPEKVLRETEKAISEGFPKASEGDPAGDRPGEGPAWVSIVVQLAERADSLQAEVDRLKSFIRADERPVVGEAPVDRSKAK